ncbi:hypothetical protein G4B88_014567 [Cannabis sativa]|uniref:Uncharacterized protein n=1 Tax=Cannabis sativa TaxID=3483 RepID=A0A7J6IAM5_CANSA|nr:hypothetical protein G4B88_014567 [Cannabis sativa]
MNSLFSCFDVFCAEVMLGKTLKISSFASPFSPVNNKALDVDNKVFIGEQDRKCLPAANDQGKKKVIRSAPEFDGLNCFETFVSY